MHDLLPVTNRLEKGPEEKSGGDESGIGSVPHNEFSQSLTQIRQDLTSIVV